MEQLGLYNVLIHYLYETEMNRIDKFKFQYGLK